jgi:hypothetical protein
MVLSKKSLGVCLKNDQATEETVTAALDAAFFPFRYMLIRILEKGLVNEMIRWVRATMSEQPRLAPDLIRLIWSADTDLPPRVELDRFQVAIEIPRGRRVKLRRNANGYSIRIEGLGEGGAAQKILSRGSRVGIEFITPRSDG